MKLGFFGGLCLSILQNAAVISSAGFWTGLWRGELGSKRFFSKNPERSVFWSQTNTRFFECFENVKKCLNQSLILPNGPQNVFLNLKNPLTKNVFIWFRPTQPRWRGWRSNCPSSLPTPQASQGTPCVSLPNSHPLVCVDSASFYFCYFGYIRPVVSVPTSFDFEGRWSLPEISKVVHLKNSISLCDQSVWTSPIQYIVDVVWVKHSAEHVGSDIMATTN